MSLSLSCVISLFCYIYTIVSLIYVLPFQQHDLKWHAHILNKRNGFKVNTSQYWKSMFDTVYTLSLSIRCHCLHVVIVYTLSLSIRCHCLYVIIVYTLSLSIRCHCLYVAIVYTLPLSIRCHCLYVVIVYTLTLSIRCHCLYVIIVYTFSMTGSILAQASSCFLIRVCSVDVNTRV